MVVLLHHCGGVGSQVTSDWPNFLNGLGYAAFTIDSLDGRGWGHCRDARNRFAVERMMAFDAYGSLDYLATLPDIDISKSAVIGFSLGGTNINNGISSGLYTSVKHHQFKAAVAYYGHCKQLDSADVPLLEIVAEHDPNYGDSCRDKGQLDGVEVALMKGAYHAFDQYSERDREDASGTRMTYNEERQVEARQITKAFLAKHLGN